jgi:hypothetical protein
MFSKINLSSIIRDHLFTLRDEQTKKYKAGDFILFLIVPLGLGLVILFGFDIRIDTGAINLLVTSLSIFAALLFNLLLLIYDIVNKEEKTDQRSSLKRRFLGQIFANISFSIFISITAVIFLLIAVADFNNIYIEDALNLIIYYLVSLFILTMFMILKRVHILLSNEFEGYKG